MENRTAARKCSCEKLVAAGWKVSCHSCGRNDLGVTLRPVAELEAGDRVLVYGDVEAVVESVGDTTKPGDSGRWAIVHYELTIGLRGAYVCPAATELPVLAGEAATRKLIPLNLDGGLCEMGDEDDCLNIAVFWLQAPGSHVVPLQVCMAHAEDESFYFGTPLPAAA